MREVFVALDYGTKRIGIAVSTELGTVHPRPRLERTRPDEDLRALAALAEELQASGFVIGLPHHMHGGRSPMEEQARAFAAALARVSARPVFGFDERLTTEAAEQILASRDLKGRARKARRDSAAACILLEDFLHNREAGEKLA